jgi:Domain of Unknown Function (DUF1080)
MAHFMKKQLTLFVFVIGTSLLRAADDKVFINGVEGYTNTPMLPGGQWHVHDPNRPQPAVVTPGTVFSAQATPPSDAIVLFNGTDMTGWVDTKGQPAPWDVVDGTMVAKKSDIHTTQEFGDIQLHVEFCEPVPATGDGQGRGNSGVFFMGKFELQVLDCYGNKTYPDGQTAALYGQHPPLVNACRPPGEWQTYDAVFTVPRFTDSGELKSPAWITVFQNGVVVQNHQAYLGPTGHKISPKYTPMPATGPLGLQFHNNPTKFRNIWVRPIQMPEQP